MTTPDFLNDHGSHGYMLTRLNGISNETLRAKIMQAMTRAEKFLGRHPELDFAFLLPTDTGLQKGIMDAVAPIRRFLLEHDLHDFSTQQQGPENKAMLDGKLLTSTESFGSKISLYRPITKKGDPRIWLFQLSQHIDPFDLLFFITDGYTVYVIDAATDFERNPDVKHAVDCCLKGNQFVPMEFNLLERLYDICDRGFIATVKTGDTGVGMTLENALGIPPNSDRGPDWHGIELKAYRVGRVGGRNTLFSEKPCWADSRYDAAGLLERFGYFDEKNKRTALYTTIYGSHYNPQGFRLVNDAENDMMETSYCDEHTGEIIPDCAVWHMEDVRKHFRDKHLCTFWVGAEARGKGTDEEFRFTNVVITHKPDYMRMEELIADGWVTVDFTLTYKQSLADPNKKHPRDHGYLWRASRQGMEVLFAKSKRYDLTE